MAIDHGLGGRNNQKSKEKRARKTEKQKKVALKALTGKLYLKI